MQTIPPVPPAPLPPTAPTPPSAPEPPPAIADGAGAGAAGADAAPATRAVPRTAREIDGLRRQREELSNQLQSAQRRRADVARALERSHDPAVRAGLEQRLGVLDTRIARLEGDIAETGRLITSAPPELLASTEAPRFDRGFGDRGPPESVIAIVFIVFVLFPLVLAASRALGRRGRPAAADPALRESAARLARLEQAVDAIAVEVERVSEGQRFVTRLLAESRVPAERAVTADPYRPG